MKIALAQINYHIGNFANNTQKIIDHIHKAEKAGAYIVVFAELAISGYPPRDFLEFAAARLRRWSAEVARAMRSRG